MEEAEERRLASRPEGTEGGGGVEMRAVLLAELTLEFEGLR